MMLENLQELFRTKITMEIKQYKRQMMKKLPEEILSRSYQTNKLLEIYEVLMEKSLCMTEQALQMMLVLPNALTLFYSKWLKYEDSSKEELDDSVNKTMEFLHFSYENANLEESKRNSAA